MAKKGLAMTKNRTVVYIIISAFLLVFVSIFLNGKQTAETFLMENHKEATEILCHEEFDENYAAIFFLDKSGYVSCALLKKEWTGYQILRISGKISLSNPGYLCSYYHDKGENRWFDWGIITDNQVISIKTESKEMKLLECDPYSYRICWLVGTGKEPQLHIAITDARH